MKIDVCDHCGNNKDKYPPREIGSWLGNFEADLCSDCYDEMVERTKELRELLSNKWDELNKIFKQYERPNEEFLQKLKVLGQVPEHATLIT